MCGLLCGMWLQCVYVVQYVHLGGGMVCGLHCVCVVWHMGCSVCVCMSCCVHIGVRMVWYEGCGVCVVVYVGCGLFVV